VPLPCPSALAFPPPPRQVRIPGPQRGLRRRTIRRACLAAGLLACVFSGSGDAARAQAARDEGTDFAHEVRQLYTVAACGALTPAPALPASVGRATLDGHCRALRNLVASWKKRWVTPAVPFLGGVVPGDLPAEVVYPFGGGDLFTALAAFPQAKVITTLSLEPAGSPIGLAAATPEDVARALEVFRDFVRRLSFATHSKTTNLQVFRKEVLPDQLAFALVALQAFDQEPVSLRFFDVRPDGQVDYLTREELIGRTQRRFADMELGFRPLGRADAPVRLYRHLQANLADRALAASPGVLAHLEAKGRVAAMTKAASYLLWSPAFSRVRDYLLRQAEFMISDSTGIPPVFAAAAGFDQETWGRFDGAFLPAARRHEEDFVRLWARGPARPLPFAFGYQDKHEHNHLLVMRRRPPGP
jgi:hypothetical protein